MITRVGLTNLRQNDYSLLCQKLLNRIIIMMKSFIASEKGEC